MMRYAKEAPEVISRRWNNHVGMLNAEQEQEADEMLRQVISLVVCKA